MQCLLEILYLAWFAFLVSTMVGTAELPDTPSVELQVSDGTEQARLNNAPLGWTPGTPKTLPRRDWEAGGGLVPAAAAVTAEALLPRQLPETVAEAAAVAVPLEVAEESVMEDWTPDSTSLKVALR